MKTFGRLAVAVALVAAAISLTACGENAPEPKQSQQQVQNSQIAEGNSANPAGNLITELDEQIIKSKVTSADSTAKCFIDTVQAYVAECVANGGKPWKSGAIEISVTDGEWTVSGYDIGAYKPDNVREELPDILKDNFSDLKTAFTKVYLNEDGRAYAAVYSPDGKPDDSEYPDEAAFENIKWKWDGKTVGVTPKGNILGTYPHLFLDEE